MPRTAKALQPLQVKNLNTPGYHAVGTVNGLYLQVKKSGAKSWVMRLMVGTKRRDLGLGGYPAVPLTQAWEKARQARQQVAEGVDPVEARKEARSRLLAAQTSGKTFAQCAQEFISEHESKWSNIKPSCIE